MPSFSDSFVRAITEAVSGIVMGLFVRSLLISSGNGLLVFLGTVVSIFGIIMLIDKIPFWGIFYTIGWIFGILYIGSKLLEWWEIPVYLAIGGFFLYIKLNHKF